MSHVNLLLFSSPRLNCRSWTFPSILAGSNCYDTRSACFNVSLNQRVLQRFHNYISNKSGFTKSSAFGASTWRDVQPLTNLTAIEQGTDQKLVKAAKFSS